MTRVIWLLYLLIFFTNSETNRNCSVVGFLTKEMKILEPPNPHVSASTDFEALRLQNVLSGPCISIVAKCEPRETTDMTESRFSLLSVLLPIHSNLAPITFTWLSAPLLWITYSCFSKMTNDARRNENIHYYIPVLFATDTYIQSRSKLLHPYNIKRQKQIHTYIYRGVKARLAKGEREEEEEEPIWQKSFILIARSAAGSFVASRQQQQ